MTWETLSSQQDASVNHVFSHPDGGFLESRFVQRTPDRFICYLSSHTGCAHSCRFCHLTATKQTMMTPATLDSYLSQAVPVLEHYRKNLESGSPAAEKVHFNFMARGDALSNPYLVENSSELFEKLGNLATDLGLNSQFLVSTIFPNDFSGNLKEIFKDERAIPYYSLYSLNPQFRKRWIPKAWNPIDALKALAQFQKETDRKVALHWAFISGENDSLEDVNQILDAVEEAGLEAKFNLVRYNPHDSRHGEEPNEEHLQFIFNHINRRMKLEGSRIVPRVGYDVKASCGMFFSGNDRT